jgi:hypothetical protein
MAMMAVFNGRRQQKWQQSAQPDWDTMGHSGTTSAEFIGLPHRMGRAGIQRIDLLNLSSGFDTQ